MLRRGMRDKSSLHRLYLTVTALLNQIQVDLKVELLGKLSLKGTAAIATIMRIQMYKATMPQCFQPGAQEAKATQKITSIGNCPNKTLVEAITLVSRVSLP